MPARIQLHRTKGWRKPEGVIVVARPTVLGNPWRVQRRPGGLVICDDYGNAHTVDDLLKAHETVVEMHRRWLETGHAEVSTARAIADLGLRRQVVRARLPELRGHDLGCWCPPEFACHADTYLQLANGES